MYRTMHVPGFPFVLVLFFRQAVWLTEDHQAKTHSWLKPVLNKLSSGTMGGTDERGWLRFG